MPAYISSADASDEFRPAGVLPFDRLTGAPRARSTQQITIALVNNMPDGALEATERQFLSLLDEASGDLEVRLRLYSVPGICRRGAAASHIRSFYSGVEALWDVRVDGIIVTGREPLTANLYDEPYWGSFTELLEWAQENTYSAIWSCLAAHAAVLYCDGIIRMRSATKRCGVFDCLRAEDGDLTAGLATSFKLPHSRWNGIPESALVRCGYRILSRSAVGVDAFTKRYKSLFVFFQGHPEYDANALLLEYRRDVGRFFRGESDRYPLLPHNYFDERTASLLNDCEREATGKSRLNLLDHVLEIISGAEPEAPWHAAAVGIYRNWLEYIGEQKKLRPPFQTGPAEALESVPQLAAIDAAVATVPSFHAKKSDILQERPCRIATAR